MDTDRGPISQESRYPSLTSEYGRIKTIFDAEGEDCQTFHTETKFGHIIIKKLHDLRTYIPMNQEPDFYLEIDQFISKPRGCTTFKLFKDGPTTQETHSGSKKNEAPFTLSEVLSEIK